MDLGINTQNFRRHLATAVNQGSEQNICQSAQLEENNIPCGFLFRIPVGSTNCFTSRTQPWHTNKQFLDCTPCCDPCLNLENCVFRCVFGGGGRRQLKSTGNGAKQAGGTAPAGHRAQCPGSGTPAGPCTDRNCYLERGTGHVGGECDTSHPQKTMECIFLLLRAGLCSRTPGGGQLVNHFTCQKKKATS